jgi:peptide/nickel transport system ATP-binding protein
MSPSSSILLVSGLGLHLAQGGRALVHDLSFSVSTGETVCLVGESGSGKSLTALSIMGLLPDEVSIGAGSIALLGKQIINLPLKRLRELRAPRMGMIFQEPMTALNPLQTIGVQIDEVLRLHTSLSKAARRERIEDILHQVHLGDTDRIYASYPHQLSGGQRQRAMIAMAIILKPALLIADEPTTALDVTTQKQILSLIAELQQRNGMGVLFITHDMGVVSEIANRVVVLRQGSKVEEAPVDQLLREPASDYTRNLLRAVPSLIPRPARPQDDAPVALRTVGLSKTYERRFVLGRRQRVQAACGVSFSLQQGRTLGIVGESGSGKSTVARCVVRLVDPSAGDIFIADTNIARLPESILRAGRDRVQFVFQDPYRSLNPRLRVGESIIEGPRNFGMSRAEAELKAVELLQRVGLPADSMSRYPHEFSGGQRQRIAIARALALNPVLLVADEAVSALDVSVQDQVLHLLQQIQQDLKIAILFITHDLRVAAQLCDDLLVMKSGQVVETGPASEVLAQPQHAYTRELIEAAPGRRWNFANFRPADHAI